MADEVGPVDAPGSPETSGLGAEPGSWRDGLSDDLRAHPSIKSAKDVEDLATQYVNAQGLIGRKGVVLPKEGDPADTDRFFGELGRPGDVDGYGLGDYRPEGESPWNENMSSEMLQAFHKHGLSTAQAKGVLEEYGSMTARGHEQQLQEHEQLTKDGMDTLRQRWGTAYDSRVDHSQRAFREFAGDSFQELAATPLSNGVALGNWPPLIEMMASMGEKMGEHGLVGEATQRFTRTPEESNHEITRLMADKDFQTILTDSTHPEHGAAMEKWTALFDSAYVEKE